MKAVEGFSKEWYKEECKKEGGEPLEIETLDEAVVHLANMKNLTMENARISIQGSGNCDWVVFEDESVLFRYYGRAYDEAYINEHIRGKY